MIETQQQHDDAVVQFDSLFAQVIELGKQPVSQDVNDKIFSINSVLVDLHADMFRWELEREVMGDKSE